MPAFFFIPLNCLSLFISSYYFISEKNVWRKKPKIELLQIILLLRNTVGPIFWGSRFLGATTNTFEKIYDKHHFKTLKIWPHQMDNTNKSSINITTIRKKIKVFLFYFFFSVKLLDNKKIKFFFFFWEYFNNNNNNINRKLLHNKVSAFIC